MGFERFKFRGIVYEIGPENKSAGGYVWREVVLTDGAAQYAQFVPVTFARDRVDLPTAFAPGALVDVEFALRGRIGANGRAFAQLYGLGIAAAQLAPPPGAHEPAPTASAPVGAPPLEAPPGSPGTPTEDLPF